PAAAAAMLRFRIALAASPSLIWFWARLRYLLAWVSKSLAAGTLSAPAAFAAAMASLAAFSLGEGSTVEQPETAAPKAITAIRRMGFLAGRGERTGPKRAAPLRNCLRAPGDVCVTTWVARGVKDRSCRTCTGWLPARRPRCIGDTPWWQRAGAAPW